MQEGDKQAEKAKEAQQPGRSGRGAARQAPPVQPAGLWITGIDRAERDELEHVHMSKMG